MKCFENADIGDRAAIPDTTCPLTVDMSVKYEESEHGKTDSESADMMMWSVHRLGASNTIKSFGTRMVS